jgi:hypothetical protein
MTSRPLCRALLSAILAICCGACGYEQGLVVLGHLDTGIERLAAASGNIPITIAVDP